MDVIEERLEREFGLDLIATAPSVIYNVYLSDGSMIEIDNPALLPDPTTITRIEEPYVRAAIMTPDEFEEYLRENYLKNIVYHIVESKVSDEKQVVEALENNKMARICICIR